MTMNRGKTRRSSSRAFAVLCVSLCAGALGCAGVTRNPLPAEFVETAQPTGIPNVRAWGGQFSPLFQADMVDSIRQAQRLNPRGVMDKDGYVNVLAISGGGPDGAFGAGLLCGWTKSGTRPAFKLVTGISTGALIAPFAFLGADYDEVLKKFYTTVKTADIYTQRDFGDILAGTDGLADTTPLSKLLEQCMDEKALAAVAAEHKKGRRLYIGTTNLDAGKLTVWNMGAIAASGSPNALNLFRQVMRASASIPVAFSPVYIPVEAGGKTYDEMHADGGNATVQVFFYGFMLDLAAAMKEAGVTTPAPIRIYVIRNGQIKSDWQAVKPRLLPIAGRAVSKLLFTQGIGDLYRIYTIASRDGIEFNLAAIPEDFKRTAKETFDPEEMGRLFEAGYGPASKGYDWQKVPPGMGPRKMPQAASAPAVP